MRMHPEMTTPPNANLDHSLQINAFIPYMRHVTQCESSLRELNLMWRLIEASAKMNCPQEARALLPMMAATRQGFEKLELDLVQSMVEQSVAGVMAGLATRARHVIDTLVRNLYERTADVGFLATDEELCRFVAGLAGPDADSVRARLQAYRSKYTVYDAILLLDPQGRVLAQTDADSSITRSRNPLIARTLQSKSHVESFGVTDLRPGHGQTLIYSHRMFHPVTGEVTAVLCLVFDFEGEMRGIFQPRSAQAAAQIALLTDADGIVLASSDTHWIGLGQHLPLHQGGAFSTFLHAGCTYLVQTAASQGYQGYPGPEGWKALVMTPVEQAFSGRDALQHHTSPQVAHGLLTHARRFCPPLHAIVTAADTIRRVVWNGQVMTAGKQKDSDRLQAVLEQIGETGTRTNEVFSQSISTLYDTVIATALHDNMLLSQLLVDLLDRNLYERANDCRWWALSPQWPQLLAAASTGTETAQQVQRANRTLTHIHQLYTVYSQIFVYDASGRILACSQWGANIEESEHPLLGMQIEAQTLAQVQLLPSPQAYYVTPWACCAQDLNNDGLPSYAYHAAIRSPQGQVLGGIGLVFHAQRELHAMLHGAAPVQQSLPTRVLYLNRFGRVMASTDPTHAVNSHMDLPPELLKLACGQSWAGATEHGGQYCIVAATAGTGYREFKRSDGYREDILAVAIQSFGAVQPDASAAVLRRTLTLASSEHKQGAQEMATFFVEADLMALDAACVLEALPASTIAPVSANRLPFCVGTLARHSQGAVAGYVWVFDLCALLKARPSRITAQSQVIVIQHSGRKLGLLVGDLQGVACFAPEQIIDPPAMAGAGMLVDKLVKANQGQLLVQRLNAANLLQVLQKTVSA